MKKFFMVFLLGLMLLSLQACDLFNGEDIDIDDSVQIDLFSSNENAVLSVDPSEIVERGTTVSVETSDIDGYQFLHWLKGSEIKSSEQTYTFDAVEDVTLEAVYEVLSQSSSVTLSADPSDALATMTPSEGFYVGSDVMFNAEPMHGFVFKHWLNLDTNSVLSTEAIFNHTLEGDLNIQAVYDVATTYHSFTYAANIANVTLTGPSESELLVGSPIALEAPSKEGYVFMHWKDVTNDLVMSDEHVYAFTLMHDLVIEAIYHEATYYEVSITSNREHINLALENPMVLAGNEILAEAKTISGLSFSHWEDESGSHVSNDKAYSFIVSEDITLIAIYNVHTSASDAAALALDNFDGDLTFLNTLLEEIISDSFSVTYTFEVKESFDYSTPDVIMTNTIEVTQKYLENNNQTILYNHYRMNSFDLTLDFTVIMVEKPLYVDLYVDLGSIINLLENDLDIDREIFGFEDGLTYVYLPLTKDQLDDGIDSIIDFIYDMLSEALNEDEQDYMDEILSIIENRDFYLDLTWLLNHELMVSDALLFEDIYLDTHLIFEAALLETLLNTMIDEMFDLDLIKDLIGDVTKEEFYDSDEYDELLEVLGLVDGYHISLKTFPYDNQTLHLDIDIYEAFMMFLDPEDLQGLHGIRFTVALNKGATITLPDQTLNAWDVGTDLLNLTIIDELIIFGDRYIDHVDLSVGDTFTLETLRLYGINIYSDTFDETRSQITIIENNDGEKDIVFDLYYAFYDKAVFKAPISYLDLSNLNGFFPESREDMEAINERFEPITLGFIFEALSHLLTMLEEEMVEETKALPTSDLVYQDHPNVQRYPNTYIVSTRYNEWNNERIINYVGSENYLAAFNYFKDSFDNEWSVDAYKDEIYGWYDILAIHEDGMRIYIEIYNSYQYLNAMEIYVSIQEPRPFPSADLIDVDELDWLPRANDTLLRDGGEYTDEFWFSYMTQVNHEDVYNHYIDLMDTNDWTISFQDSYTDGFSIHATYGYYSVDIYSSRRSNIPYMDTLYFYVNVYDESPEPLPQNDLTQAADHEKIPRYEDSIHISYSSSHWQNLTTHHYAVENTTLISIKDYFIDDIFTSINEFDPPVVHDMDDWYKIEVYHGYTLFTVQIYESADYIDAIGYTIEIRPFEVEDDLIDHPFVSPMEGSLLTLTYDISLKTKDYIYVSKASLDDIQNYFMDSSVLAAQGFNIGTLSEWGSNAFIDAYHPEWELYISIHDSFSSEFPGLTRYIFTITDLTPDPIPSEDLVSHEDDVNVPRFPNAIHIDHYYNEWNKTRTDYFLIHEDDYNNLINYFTQDLLTPDHGFASYHKETFGDYVEIFTHLGVDLINIEIYRSEVYIDAYEYIISIQYYSNFDINVTIPSYDLVLPNSYVFEYDYWMDNYYFEAIMLNSIDIVYQSFLDKLTSDSNFDIDHHYHDNQYAFIQASYNNDFFSVSINQDQNLAALTFYTIYGDFETNP